MKDTSSSFLEEFASLSQAGVGVFVVRTREPHRVRRALMSYAFGIAKRRAGDSPSPVPTFAFASWDRVLGWREFTPEEDSPKGSGGGEALPALSQVAGVNADESTAMKEGIYLMENVHTDFTDVVSGAAFLQLIKHYAHELTGEKDYTIVLSVPEGTQIPHEIEDDVKLLAFNVPSSEELAERTTSVLEHRKQQVGADKFKLFKPATVLEIAKAGQGLSLLDFEHALDLGLLRNVMHADKPSAKKVAATIRRSKVDVVKRSQVLELIEPRSLSEMGGYGRLKSYIKDYEIAYSPEARAFGVDSPKGILMAGVQGTGKSLAAKSVGGILKLNTVRFDVGKCFGKYVGESEERTDIALNQAIAMAPIVIWADEIDKGGFGTNGDSGSSDRVLAKLLTAMQEHSDKGIFWVFSANRVNNGAIPPELIRKGRLDEIFFLGLPTANERRAVFDIHITKRGHDTAKVAGLEDAVAASEGFIPAEIESIVNMSLLDAFKAGKKTIDGKILCARIKATVPMSKAHEEDVKRIIDWGSRFAVNASDDVPSSKLNPGSKVVRTLRDR